jgi:hypothetical protein
VKGKNQKDGNSLPDELAAGNEPLTRLTGQWLFVVLLDVAHFLEVVLLLFVLMFFTNCTGW